MYGPTGMVLAPIMGQYPSATDMEKVGTPSTTILREDSIHVYEEGFSRPNSFSIHYDCTDQAPYTDLPDDQKMSSTDILRSPDDTHDLAVFLQRTGPIAPHRRPSKAERPPRKATAPEKALRFFRMRSKRPRSPHLVLYDEGGLLHPIPKGVEQKQTAAGKKYLALQPKTVPSDSTPNLGADIVDSQVSIQFADEMHHGDMWHFHSTDDHSIPSRQDSPQMLSVHAMSNNDDAIQIVTSTSSPVRPSASNPPTPPPDSAISTLADSYICDIGEHPAKQSYDAARALSSHPVHPSYPSSSYNTLPKVRVRNEGSPLKRSLAQKEIEIKHPSPRRFASHTVLLQRASSIASSLNPRSVSGSPGPPPPPPPRSPLRLRRDNRTIENLVSCRTTSTRQSTPRLAPSIRSVEDLLDNTDLMKPTVVTDCTGPIKRPRSRGKKHHPAYPASRKEREERVRARKAREQIQPTRAIDAVVSNPTTLSRHRLRKARPHINIPELRPAPLMTRASSSGSSSPSWKKITEYTRTPVSPVPSQDSPGIQGEKQGYPPTSPTMSTGNSGSSMALSPVMLVAEEIPVPKARSTPKPARLVLHDGKSYAARPRSASLSRAAHNRKSRTVGASGSQTSGSQRSNQSRKDYTPPLPSPPPNIPLPPTPPASGSESKVGKARVPESCFSSKKDLPPVPFPQRDVSPLQTTTSPTRIEHIITQAQLHKKPAFPRDANKASRIDARLEAVERQNALLSAALMAVLKTNGALNTAPLLHYQQADQVESPKSPPAWQTRIARRSAASHGPSSSEGSALEMYMSTRQGGGKQYRC